MPTQHTIKTGECLSSITKKYGFSDYKTIYNHPQNAEFKRKFPNPNVIHDGAVLFIPDKELKEVPSPNEQKHPFVLKREKTFIHLLVKDSEGKPFANVKYNLTVADKVINGTTGGDGKISEEILAEANSAELFLFSKSGEKEVIGVISLELGALEPVEDDIGVQARLNNLGFDCGEAKGALDDPQTEAAIKAFQGKNGLPETGTADDATRGKLRQMHDWE